MKRIRLMLLFVFIGSYKFIRSFFLLFYACNWEMNDVLIHSQITIFNWFDFIISIYEFFFVIHDPRLEAT